MALLVTNLTFLLVVVLAIVAPLVLYVLVRNEGQEETMSREEAERAARRDTDDRR
ncbi:hypothetical protein [Halovenus halobia]|uniref:hypothetical protein n=1 Tax=Halovenus halobia TaxID=3396622 RepID=UPI003F55D899